MVKLETSHLRSGINRLKQVSGCGVPKFNGPVGCTSASGQGLRLPGTPADCFYGCRVSAESVDWGVRNTLIPKLDQVIVGTCQIK